MPSMAYGKATKVVCCGDLGSRNCCLGRRQSNVMLKDDHYASLEQLCVYGSDAYPAMPIDCRICRLAFNASQ